MVESDSRSWTTEDSLSSRTLAFVVQSVGSGPKMRSILFFAQDGRVTLMIVAALLLLFEAVAVAAGALGLLALVLVAWIAAAAAASTAAAAATVRCVRSCATTSKYSQ